MNKENPDIELIRRYFSGKLDKKAMHTLEKRALEDPFLADAMEGYEEFSTNSNTFIELNERLKDRLKNKPQKGITANPFNFKNWSIAASVVLLIGLISIYLNQPKETNFSDTLPPASEKPALAQTQPFDSATTGNISNDEKLNTIIESREIVASAQKAPRAEENLPPTDIVVEALKPNEIPVNALADNETRISAFNSKTDISSENNIRAKSIAAISESNLKEIADTSTNKGRITDKATGMPLLGVVITNKKTGISVLSNEKGEFILPGQASTLSFNMPGYEPKEIETKNTSENLNISLKSMEVQAFSEKKPVQTENTRKRTTAGPKDGWASFKKYLSANSELESGETGHVIVEFVIKSNGELSDFKILKSLSKLADARAIDLIKNYQFWLGASDGNANRVKVTVRFN